VANPIGGSSIYCFLKDLICDVRLLTILKSNEFKKKRDTERNGVKKNVSMIYESFDSTEGKDVMDSH
jgi:hypothetical protein